MNQTSRRGFLKAVGASAASLLVPSWIIPERRPSYSIDLSAFCHNKPWQCGKYDMHVPFVQMGVVDDAVGCKSWQKRLGLPGSHFEPFRYATDDRVCVRVPINTGDLIDKEKKDLPPVGTLGWTHTWNYRGRWVRWPRAAYLDAADTECLRCCGTGDLAGCPLECDDCGGTGHEWVGSEYDISHPIRCRACKGKGCFVKEECPKCKGNAIGIFPGIQRLEQCYIDCDYHRKISCLSGVEYFVPENPVSEKPIRFRFDGGVGLLMPLDQKRAEERIAQA